MRTVVVAPLTATEKPYPSRVTMLFQGKRSHIALDQLRAVDKGSLIRNLGSIAPAAAKSVSSVLVEMFTR